MHVIVGLNTGGAENMLLRLVGGMGGHTHVVVSLTTQGKLAPAFVGKGIPVYALNMRRSPLGLSVIWKLWRLMREIRPDVIQTWMYHADLFGGIAGRLAGVKSVIWNIRNTEIPQKGLSFTGLVIRLDAMFSRWLPERIVCCAYAGLEKHAALGFCRQRMVVIPNGYDVNDFGIPSETRDFCRLGFGLSPNAKIVGIVGRYDPLKGYDLFIKAAGLLAERCSDDILFLMVGPNVVDTNEVLQQLIADFGGKARFKLMGERQDISRIMFVLDVYCLSSIAEGFPNVVAEAMLMQVPCVVSDVGDAKRIVGGTGLVVPPGDPHALADALHTMLGMEEVRRDWGRAARQRVVENYGMEKIVAQYAKLYEESLRSH